MASGETKSFPVQMHWQVGAVILMWWYLAASTAAHCNIQFCGSQNVSYPFWIDNPNCGYPGFQISCREKENGNSSGLFLEASVNGTHTEFEILEIDYAGSLIINSTSLKAMSCNETDDAYQLFELPPYGPFTIAPDNKFVVIGCRSKGSFKVYDEVRGGGGEVICRTTTCLNQHDPVYCNTYGCCESGIPGNQRVINFTGGGIRYRDFPGCGFSTILDPLTWYLPPKQYGVIAGGQYGLRLQWAIGYGDCLTAKGTANYSCARKAQCLNATGGGHACKCSLGYEGTGYSNGTGCTDVDECNQGDMNQCVEPSQGGVCYNLPGSYNCSCAKDYSGDGFQNGTRCLPPGSKKIVIPAIIGSVSSFVVVCVIASLLVCWLKKRHLKVVEAKYYQQLQQYIASRGGRESLRMFSADELARAANNYSKEMVLGSGGFGTVFKGILLDGTLVAIKMSKQALNLEDDHEFLNEIAILSQLNHRNIVKLLGCCIQTKFPLLVSEFVPNRTLFEHLQSEEMSLPWASRLQIAIETAEALAYLHSGASQPIFHRDVKSSNILLDETFSPKVVDFGISRLISASNNTHHSTSIMGTKGYLDPEYFQTYQLTDKSDVFSFGVVLVELLTGLKPLNVERINGEWNLSALFLARLNDNSLREILDTKVLEEENLQQMENMAKLAKVCLHLERRKRPSMKEVVEELVWIRGGTRKTKFHDSGNAVFEQTSISIKASQRSCEFRSYSFPSTDESTSEEPFTALIQMSNL